MLFLDNHTWYLPNFGEYFNLVLLFEKNSPLRELFVYEPMTNLPEVFTSTPNRIPIFWANMTNTCWSKANLLELFMFLTIYESKSNNYSTLMHKTWIKICLITQKWLNIIWYFAWMLFDIRFDIRFEVEYFDLESSLFCFIYYST